MQMFRRKDWQFKEEDSVLFNEYVWEGVIHRYSSKKEFLKILQFAHENTFESLFNKVTYIYTS